MKKVRTVPMARGRRKKGEIPFSSISWKKNILFLLVFLGAASVGWGIMSVFQESDTQIGWRSCLLEQGDGTLYPKLEQIPAGVYELPASLIGIGVDQMMSAEIDTPFLIQNEEVTLKQFSRYAEYVAALPDSKEKERLLIRLGVQWQKGETVGSSVNAVSWEGALDYARWLGQKTGCTYGIPSQKEWMAAISYLQARDQIKVNGTVPPIGPVRNLLWGVREWSSTQCSSGYFLLGRDDLTTNYYESQATCMPPMFAVAGFRLVLNPATGNNPANPPSR